jgi:O-Antigen ligase
VGLSAITARERVVAGRRTTVRGLEATALLATAFLATAGLTADNGGFFPSSWGWASLGLLAAAIVGLLCIPQTRLRRLELLLLGGIAAVAAWTWLSIAWSSSRTQSVLTGERTLVLVAGVATAFVLASRRPVASLVGGVFAATVAVSAYALTTRLFPDRFGYHPGNGYRLSTPVGYWNGLGLFAAMGILLAVGEASRGRSRIVRALAAAGLVVLLPTMYFTFSRGSWLALGIGVVALVVLDPRRLQAITTMLVLAPVPAIAVYLSSRSAPLTRAGAPLSAAVHDGHRLSVILLGLCALQLGIAFAFAAVERRARVGRSARVAFAAVLVVVLVVGLAGLFERKGSPWSIAHHAYVSFTAPTADETSNLNQRLFTFSGNGRWGLWTVAWEDARHDPWLGSGAGTYGEYWLQHRTVDIDVLNAHNLYLETLAELGPFGLALVVLTLGVPLLAAVRYRRHRLVPAAGAAFAVFISGALVDWDWQLAGVTLGALLVGVACVVAGRELPGHSAPARRGARAVSLVSLGALVLVAVVTILGNTPSAHSQSEASAGEWTAAEASARQVIRWAPWSSIGWQELGEAQLGLKQLASAHRSIVTAIRKDPDNWVLWLDLSASSTGPAKQAALDRALELNPLSPDLHALAEQGGSP